MDAKDVLKLHDFYKSRYEKNNQRAKSCIDFSTDNQQWDAGAAMSRQNKNKETLTFNNIKKYLNRIKSQNSQLDFQTNVYQKDASANQAEYKSLDLLIKHWFTNDNISEKFNSSFNKCIDYGYAVAEVNYHREDYLTMNLEPNIIIYDDPSEAFFDLKATLKSRIDGNFCGRCRELDEKDLLHVYPEFAASNGLKKSGNKLIDFWQREEEKCWYVKMKTRQWLRQDLLNDTDYLQNVERDVLGKIMRKRGTKYCIYYYRYLNEITVIDRAPYPTEDLPLVYHSGLTEWTKDGFKTYPYAFYLKDAQKLLNLAKSQIATNLKNSTGTKYFFGPNHVTQDHNIEQFRDINKYEGAIPVGDDPNKMLVIQPTELPATQISAAQMALQDIESIAGSMSDVQMSDAVVTSSVAIKEITNNIQMINVGLVGEHVRFIDSICHLIVQMTPEIVTEQRDFFVKNEDEKVEKISINVMTETGLIINNIKNLRNGFMYEVKVGASTTMQKQDTKKDLIGIYSISPQLLQSTADIFFKNSDYPDAIQLARRAQAMIDPNLIKVGNGEMTQEEFHQMKTQAPPPQPPVNPAEMMVAQAEQAKAQAATQNAQTNQAKAQAQIQQQQNDQQLNQVKVSHEIGAKDTQNQLEATRVDLEATQKMIDAARLSGENSDANSVE